MGRLFGTNGIRGIFGDGFDLEFVHDVTLSFATYFRQGPILVGYDGRNSSLPIAKTVCSALNYAGIDCNLAGLVPTPALEFAVKDLGYAGGIMITASHNPPSYNGLKPVASNGVEISRDDELLIEKIYFSKQWTASQRWGECHDETRTIGRYLDGIKKHVNVEKIRSKKFKIVLDVGNGAQAVAAPLLCADLNCTVYTVNDKIDGTFPGRGSEPTPANLNLLSKTIRDTNADVGIAFDGDGDRSLICDQNGIVLTGDKSALLLSKFLLQKNPNSIIVTCLNSSHVVESVAAQFSSKVRRAKVGSVEVSHKMIKEGALIGFEENGGFMFGPHNQVRDGCMTMALVLDMLAACDQSMADLVSQLPSSFTTKDKIPCTKNDAQKIIDTLSKEYHNIDLTDGIKITFDDNQWIMVRPSGTEPIIRIYGEADSQQNLDALMTKMITKIKSIIHE